MSIRPTDLQILVQKTQEVEKIQQNQQQQERVQQQQFADQLHKKTEVKEHQVQSTPHADEVKISTKEKNTKNQQHKKKNKHSKEQEAMHHKELADTASDHIIDLKI